MTEKLHRETRKLLVATKTGTRCFNRDGASTGSGATSSSTSTNATENTPAKARGMTTQGSSHYGNVKFMNWESNKIYRVVFIELHTQERQESSHLLFK